MYRKAVSSLICLMLSVLMFLSPALAETREGVIALEGEEQTIEETLLESPLGFSFWYVAESFDAWTGEMDYIEGVIIESLYSDDFMILSLIPEEDAEDYAEDLDEDIIGMSYESRVQADIYRDLEDGRYYFLSLIADEGQYIRAVGEYSEEAAEGNARYFQKILDSIEFLPGMPGCLFRALWESEAMDDQGRVQVTLRAMEPVTDVQLLNLEWDGITVSWEEGALLGNFDARQEVIITVEFIGDMPNNGVMYTDEEGYTHYYALDISGEDGELYLWDIID
ncbi:MAG: hypothetical protein IK133_01715 [Clostridia bacterium]|nr:hypothetical protein [Clostridia bacterium]